MKILITQTTLLTLAIVIASFGGFRPEPQVLQKMWEDVIRRDLREMHEAGMNVRVRVDPLARSTADQTGAGPGEGAQLRCDYDGRFAR